MNGIINILKPAGMTSHDVIGAMRRLIGIKRIGHTGTLDPMAVGVLPICIGRATRIIEYLDPDYKKYRCEMQLGIQTDTEDIWGKVLQRKNVRLSPNVSFEADSRADMACCVINAADVLKAAEHYVGDIIQVPPNYSAVRVAGKRLYEYARSGEAVQAAPRHIHVKSLKIIKMDFDTGRVLFDIESSKGSYIRTICTEIGKELGCGAAMSFLVRTACGSFSIENAITLEELEIAILENRLSDYLLPMDYPLARIPSIVIRDPQRATAFINGGPVDVCEVDGDRIECDTFYKVYCKEKFIAIAKYHPDNCKIISEKVFCRELEI